jgi:hypothetical protein
MPSSCCRRGSHGGSRRTLQRPWYGRPAGRALHARREAHERPAAVAQQNHEGVDLGRYPGQVPDARFLQVQLRLAAGLGLEPDDGLLNQGLPKFGGPVPQDRDATVVTEAP